ncbi:hypothetical protein HJ093_22930 [Vibrio parahaemolyticus]|uniref:hypothetical protein n=1 Tax=Vibrio parahaemolyticus TaxID=670 RepID=UPI001869D1FC|nr:hypothetical protein [Vibrio parahaemolyticus]MBE4196033.1 hypothetical protein [Vibrio parahaemolyticus]
MKLSKLCEKAYLRWINQETWSSSHPKDKERFHCFVQAYTQYGRKQVSGYSIQLDIINRYQGKLEDSYLKQKSEYYGWLFEELVDYRDYLKKN